MLLVVCFSLYGVVLSTVCTWLNQNQYLRCGMSGQAIGWVYIAVSVASMSGVFSQRFTDRVGRTRAALGAPALAGLACITLALTRSAALSVGCFLFMEATCSLTNPLMSQIWNRQVTGADRATQLSIYAVLDEAIAAGGTLVLGRAADISLDTAFLLGGAVCILSALAAAVFCRRYFA